MRVLYMAGRELDYPRNDVLLRAFRRLGTVEVIGETRSGSLLWRTGRVLFPALPRLLTEHYDLIFVGFYGHLLMLLVGPLSRSPVLFDAFVSTYDTLCFDRELFAPHSLPGRLAFWLDQMACRLAHCVLLDTPLHADYFVRTFAVSPNQIRTLPVGCNEEIFFPRGSASANNTTCVLYYCTYLPLHGVEIVVRAAALLRSEPRLCFRLVGAGQTYAQVRRLADSLDLQNMTFVPSVPLKALPVEIAAADICLGGHFGYSTKAYRVIPSKIYQILAMARPLIAADTPANRELLSHEETAYLCPSADPEALASGILNLHQDVALRDQLAARGRALYLERCSEAVITERLRQLVVEMIR